jgi:hypothetical protein
MSIAPLVADADTDLAGWQAGDQATFLEMVCAEVRRFCGWHIAPTVSVVGKRCWLGQQGLVLLGSTFVTAVTDVSVEGQTLTEGCDYTWQEPKGWLRMHPRSLPTVWGRAPDPSACVSFTHGYEETPPDVKAVIFEVLATSMELPASNATLVETVQYRFNLKDSVGVALSPQQKERLGRYRLRSFGGLVRP